MRDLARPRAQPPYPQQRPLGKRSQSPIGTPLHFDGRTSVQAPGRPSLFGSWKDINLNDLPIERSLHLRESYLTTMRAAFQAFCVVLLLLFAAGNASAQIGAVIEALPADRLYVAGISASISGYNTMTNIERVRALRLYVYQHTPFDDPLIHDQVVNLPLNDAYAVFAKGNGGLYCGGAAIMLSRVYKAAGFNSWIYNFGEPEQATHQTTLVEVDGDVILQDGFFNYEYVDALGKPIAFLDLISLTIDDTPPTAMAGTEAKLWLFKDRAEVEQWVGPNETCQSTAGGVRCIATITLWRFLEKGPDIFEFLHHRGWPRQLEYLMLYPISLVSMYSDGAARAESLSRDLERKIGSRVKIHSFVVRAGWPRQLEYLMFYPVRMVSAYLDRVPSVASLFDRVKPNEKETSGN